LKIDKDAFGVKAAVAIFLFCLCTSMFGRDSVFDKDELTPYTELQLKIFHAQHMRGVLEEGLLIGKHPIREVNARYATLMNLIKERYGMYPQMNLSPKYDKAGRDIMASSSVKNKIPALNIIVPFYMDYYASYRSLGVANPDALLANSLVISIHHELDHLAYALTGEEGSGRDLIKNETNAWAYTCEKTIRIFVDKGVPLTENDLEFYQAWVKAGRSVKSKKWIGFIKSSYAHHAAERNRLSR
jgi:hypothetical protein